MIDASKLGEAEVRFRATLKQWPQLSNEQRDLDLHYQSKANILTLRSPFEARFRRQLFRTDVGRKRNEWPKFEMNFHVFVSIFPMQCFLDKNR